MEKIIEADILDLDDFFEKYNKELVSRDLINFILRNSFKVEYQKMVNEHFNNNKKQVIYFLIGVVMLVISRILNDRALIEELFLIGGWVLIWQTVEIEFFGDTLNHKKRKLLKKLITSEIIEKEIK